MTTIRERHEARYPGLATSPMALDLDTLLGLMDEARLYLNIFQQILNLKEPDEAKRLEKLRKRLRETVG